MDFFEVVKHRQSFRKFTSQAIEEDKLQRILNAINLAPSAGNFQSYEIYVARGQERTRQLAAATFGQDFVGQAPLALVFCMNPARCQYDGREALAMQDASIACTHAMLAVTALELTSVWIGAFDPATVSKLMNLPAGLAPLAILPIGYPDEMPERTPRRELADIAHEW